MNVRTLALLGIASVICGMLPATSFAYNQLDNAGFEDWFTEDGGYTTYTGVGAGPSASQYWDFNNDNYGTTTTQEVTPPAGLEGSGSWSLLVTSTAAGNGIYQGTPGTGEGIYVASVSGWVYVVSGSVGIVLGEPNGDVTYASTSTEGQWINLAANTGGVNGSAGLAFEALSPYTEFYVDNADADTNPLPTPEPASFLGLGLGAFALLRRRRKV